MSRAAITLTQFLIDERRRFPGATGDFNSLMLDVANACKTIARTVAQGKLDPLHMGVEDDVATTRESLEAFSHDAFLRLKEVTGTLAGLASEQMATPYSIPLGSLRGKYLLLFDPLNGAANVDVNSPVGSVFSVLRTDRGRDVTDQDFLQPGTAQVAAGYALYGPSTMLVLTVGRGVYGFTLAPFLGEFYLTHRDIRIPDETNELAVDGSNSRAWETPVKRYVNECLAGTTGARGKDFTIRWVSSVVAVAHRILLRGGVFLYPHDARTPPVVEHLQLLYEANPLGFLIEQAGGRASTGRGRLLDVAPKELHQRIGVALGSRSEIERLERYHEEPSALLSGDPLFAERGLFRD
jgi:fructose-1,6-bisphosphatase I/sedoheptulose-1,7-bisphosphatase